MTQQLVDVQPLLSPSASNRLSFTIAVSLSPAILLVTITVLTETVTL